MPIYTNDPYDDGLFPVESSLRSSIGIGPKVTKAIDDATKDWLDKHPEATTTVEDDSITNVKLKDGSVNSRTIEDESIATDDIADLAVTTPKIGDNAVTGQKLASDAITAMPTMSASQIGVARVGPGLSMNGDALELDGDGDIAAAVTAWLNAHPEATTTVQDRSVTPIKLNISSTITPTNYQTSFPTFNANLTAGIYLFAGFGYGSNWPSGGPYTPYKGGGACSVLIVMNSYDSTVVEQVFIDIFGIWTRSINPSVSSWGTWTSHAQESIYLDASNYSARLASVTDSKPNAVYILNFANGATAIPSGLPVTTWVGNVATLICMDDFYKQFTSYLFIQGSNVYTSVYNRNTGTFAVGWSRPDVADGSIDADSIAANVVPKLSGSITPSNYESAFPTFNADFDTSIYSFSSFAYGNGWPSGGPYPTYKGSPNSVLINVKQPNSTIIEQIFVDANTTWRRYINPAYDSYGVWHSPSKSTELINRNNYGTRLPSVRNSEPNTSYILNFTAGSTDIPSDLPTDYWEGNVATLTCIDDYAEQFTSYLFAVADKAYIRVYNHTTGTFVSKWRQVSGSRDLYVSQNQTGTGFYDNFAEACLEAYNDPYMHPTVHVLDGSYDVGAELDEMLGGLDTLTESSTHPFKYGIALGGYDIMCSGNASMYFHYTGDNEYILNMLSMFDVKKNNGSDPSFRIVGMYASGSRTRYLIHDDTSGNNRRNRVPIHEYKDCTLEFDNRNNEHRVGAQVIGGGLGMATVVDISGCVFIQHDTNVTGTVTYHNNFYAGSQSQVNITGCYFTSGGIIFGYYGSSTLQTVCRVSNCSLTYGPAKREEVTGSTDNMTLYAWNNEVR